MTTAALQHLVPQVDFEKMSEPGYDAVRPARLSPTLETQAFWGPAPFPNGDKLSSSILPYERHRTEIAYWTVIGHASTNHTLGVSFLHTNRECHEIAR